MGAFFIGYCVGSYLTLKAQKTGSPKGAGSNRGSVGARHGTRNR